MLLLLSPILYSHFRANGDGFGVGWYGALPTPGVFHSTEPAWNDKNLHELADHISSSNFFAHIRAAIGSSVQQTNCHPERELYEEVSEDAHMVVSEPLGEIPGVWNEVPEATCRIVGHGRDELRPFRPQAP
jgi:predicted glutamine amidotransferase